MKRRSILRTAPLLLAAAALATACSELPSSALTREPGYGPRLTVTPTNALFQIDLGQTHSCGLSGSGQSWCWGRNNYGQLGDSTATNRSTAVATYGGYSFTQISAGQSHTCGITSGGQAYCWGENADGRLGDGTTANMPLIPVAVQQGSLSFTAISAGTGHTCALTSSGQAYCWGANSSGQLGDNSTQYRLTPVAVQQPGGVTFFQIQAGQVHTCALALGGQAYCWGYGGDGQLGYGFTVGDSVPQTVTQSGVSFTSIYTEYNHTCALTSGGLPYCWGLNSNSQLGDSTTTRRYTPVAARRPAGVTYTDMALGGFSTCAISTTNQAYCWGLGSSGQLGNGSTANSRLPVAVSQPAGVGFYVIRSGSTHVCAVDAIGQVWCWGNNLYGQLGDNTTNNSSVPVAAVH